MDELQEQDVPQLRDHIAGRVATLPPGTRVLELGSGPGFLAHRVLERCANLQLDMLPHFSESATAGAPMTVGRVRPAVRSGESLD
jgi:hypothetical protein